MKTIEIGGTRGFRRVKGRKRHILVDTLGLPAANRVAAADVSDRRAGALPDEQGLEAEEVCEILGISEGNMRVVLHRARLAIRAALDGLM